MKIRELMLAAVAVTAVLTGTASAAELSGGTSGTCGAVPTQGD